MIVIADHMDKSVENGQKKEIKSHTVTFLTAGNMVK